MPNTNKSSNVAAETTNESAVDSTTLGNETPTITMSSLEQGLALYLDAKRSQDELLTQLAEIEAHMSDVCKNIALQFTPKDGKLVFDLGDGNERGSIIVQRGNLFFIRGRNSGRPKGSKGKKSAKASQEQENAQAAETATEQAEVSEEVAPEVADAIAAEMATVQDSVAKGEVSTETKSEQTTETQTEAARPTTIIPPAALDAIASALSSVPGLSEALAAHIRPQDKPAQTPAAG